LAEGISELPKGFPKRLVFSPCADGIQIHKEKHMKLIGSVIVFVLLLATTVLAVTPMTPSQQYQTLLYRDAQFEARYAFFINALNNCGGSVEITEAWAQSDAAFNTYVLSVCGGTDPSQIQTVYDTGSNQCKTGVTMTPDQQYQTMQLRIKQFSARYAALETQAAGACHPNPLPPISNDWVQSDLNMNTWLTTMCGSPTHYSTSTNNCK
jgi:hypothetical protein